MKASEFIDDIQKKIGDAIKNLPTKEVEGKVKAMMADGFNRLDLVTRAEFDTQAQVLARTRERLEALEHRVAALEEALRQR